MVASTPSKDVIEVPKYMLDILICLRRLLELYQSIFLNEPEIIKLLIKEIEQISEKGHGFFLIESLISEYDYPRKFEEEDEDEIYDVDSFILSTRNNS
jgi:hypothetical protein